jgi:GMC oxidoreductase
MKARIIALLCFALLVSCDTLPSLNKSVEISQDVRDEARLVNRSGMSFPAADEDYFGDMDGGVPLSPEEVKGRNTWIVWSGGNDRFWDELSGTTNLRVVDASIFPYIPGFFIVTPIYMIAEKASEVILADAKQVSPV